MNDRFINKVKVIKSFPGYDEGNILIKDKSTGLFRFDGESYNKNINSLTEVVFSKIVGNDISLTKKQILDNMEYFEDISDYEMKDKEWVLERIEELKIYIRELDKDVEDDVVSVDVDVKESRAVWQNIIWEYETLLGMRKLIG